MSNVLGMDGKPKQPTGPIYNMRLCLIGQADIDIKNNKKALDDLKANKQLKEYDKAILDSLLKEITIPPVPGYLEDTSFNR